MGAIQPVRLCLIAPPLAGPATGGTLYNRALTAALQRTRVEVQACTLEELATRGPDAADAIPQGAVVLVDSLYLERFAELQERVPARPIWLLLHYLPTQVRLGRAVTIDELSASERHALSAAHGYVVTSPFMAEQLHTLGLDPSRVLCVEPGTVQITRIPREDGQLRAVMLANVVEAKGLLPLLHALGQRLQAPDALTLDVAGSLEAEPDYVAACRSAIGAHPALRARVHLLGALAHEDALVQLSGAQVLCSASRMESYGMALAEARSAGVPIVALAGGNARAHVERSAGGMLCNSCEELASELLRLVRGAHVLRERDRLARRFVRARSWALAAAELSAGFAQARA